MRRDTRTRNLLAPQRLQHAQEFNEHFSRIVLVNFGRVPKMDAMVIKLEERLVAKVRDVAPDYLTVPSTQVNWIVEAYLKLRNETLVRMILAEAAATVTDDPGERKAFVDAVYASMIKHELLPKPAEKSTAPTTDS